MARKAGSGNSERNSGNGGETHQTASAPTDRLTTNHGTPLGDNQNSLKSWGPRAFTAGRFHPS